MSDPIISALSERWRLASMHGPAATWRLQAADGWLTVLCAPKSYLQVLDVGCGVGGPAREIVTFSGCDVTGLNNNAYQVTRANAITAQRGLSEQLNFVKGDFQTAP